MTGGAIDGDAGGGAAAEGRAASDWLTIGGLTLGVERADSAAACFDFSEIPDPRAEVFSAGDCEPRAGAPGRASFVRGCSTRGVSAVELRAFAAIADDDCSKGCADGLTFECEELGS